MAAHLDQRQLERHNQSHGFHWPNLVLLLSSKVVRTPDVIYNTQWGKHAATRAWFSGVILLPMVCISAPWRLSLVTCTRRNYSVLARPSLGGSLARPLLRRLCAYTRPRTKRFQGVQQRLAVGNGALLTPGPRPGLCQMPYAIAYFTAAQGIRSRSMSLPRIG